MKKEIISATLAMVILSSTVTFAEPVYTAKPTGQTVTLNGEKVSFAAYNIEGNNYFKLRDLATVMDGTEKNFNVDYNKEKDSVEITSLTPYIAGNTGISGYTKKGDQKATNSPQSMYLDGEKTTLQAYAVLDYNYCKLRDVADLLDFAVDWNANTNTINIGTDRGYDESTTIQKPEMPVVSVNPNLDAATQKAVRDVVAEIGPGGVEYGRIKDHYDQKDWDQMTTNPYSSKRLSYFFDEYKKYGDIETFKISVAGWLTSGGDDADTAARIEVFG